MNLTAHPLRPRAFSSSILAIAAALALAACGGGVDTHEEEHDDHDHGETIATAGRLAISESNSTTLRVQELDTGTIEASHTLDNAPSALYPSPGGRYAVAMQRTQGTVQFVDGGLWQEDHGDHLHDYRQASRLLSWRLTGSQPTHYDLQAGVQAAIFLDGNATTTPVQNAGVRVITEASIAAAATTATLDLSFPIHGLAEPVGDKLLTPSRASDATMSGPTHLDLQQRNGSSYSLVRQLPTRCDGMHGSYSSGDYTVAGCTDGMLVVRHDSATEVSSQKVNTALRVATIAGHPRLPNHYIGIATEGVAPAVVTTRFYALDAATGTAGSFTPQGWTAGNVRRAHAFDRSGQRFYVLDDQGTLIVSQWQSGGWTPVARITGAVPAMPTAAPWPAIVANGSRDEIYLTDPVANQVVSLNSTTGAVVSRRALGFTPSYAVWLGVAR